MIKFLDLKNQYDSIKDEIDEAIKNVINDTAFIGGKYVTKFEEEFAGYFPANCGNPALPARLVVGVLYLKHAFNFFIKNIFQYAILHQLCVILIE